MMKNKYDIYKKLSPQMLEVVKTIKAREQPPTEDWRQDYVDERAFWNEGGPQPVKVVEAKAPGPHGEIPVRLHYPTRKEKSPVIVFIHGGGFYLGNNDTHSRIMRILADESGAVVVGVDYRLAPEFMFPVQVDETVAVARWVHEHGEEYGLDGNDVSLAGDSGGATLALAANLYLRDEDKDNSYITSLLLYYGAFGMRDSISLRLYGNEFDGLMRESMGFYDEGYIKPEDLKSPYYDLMDNDLTFGIPPTLLCCGDADPLIDNSTALREILTDKGLTCEYKIYPGVMHAFLHYSKMLPDAWDALKLGAEFRNRYGKK